MKIRSGICMDLQNSATQHCPFGGLQRPSSLSRTSLPSKLMKSGKVLALRNGN